MVWCILNLFELVTSEGLKIPVLPSAQGLLAKRGSWCITPDRVFVISALMTMCWISERPLRSYLFDPASSHMLVSKIKPCMSKYKWYTMKLRMAH